MRRVLWAVLVVGALLVAAPFAMGLPGKASGGQAMIDNFSPIMAQDNVDITAAYYNDVFLPLGDVVPAVTEENMATFDGYLQGIQGMELDAQSLVPGLAQALGMTPEQVQQFFAAGFPSMAQMLQGLPQMREDFAVLLGLISSKVEIFQQVPAGLEHYAPLVSTMQSNVGNYDEVSSLPDFRLFTWFFVVPGALLVLLAGFGLLSEHAEVIAAATKSRRPTLHGAAPV